MLEAELRQRLLQSGEDADDAITEAFLAAPIEVRGKLLAMGSEPEEQLRRAALLHLRMGCRALDLRQEGVANQGANAPDGGLVAGGEPVLAYLVRMAATECSLAVMDVALGLLEEFPMVLGATGRLPTCAQACIGLHGEADDGEAEARTTARRFFGWSLVNMGISTVLPGMGVAIPALELAAVAMREEPNLRARALAGAAVVCLQTLKPGTGLVAEVLPLLVECSKANVPEASTLMADLVEMIPTVKASTPKLHLAFLQAALSALAAAGQANAEPLQLAILTGLQDIFEQDRAMTKQAAEYLLPELVAGLLTLVCSEPDNPAWEVEDDAKPSPVSADAEITLDALAILVDGARFRDAFLPLVQRALTDPARTWATAHGALQSLAATTEGMGESLWAALDGVLPAIIALLQDPHPRVRYGCLQVLGQFANDFGSRSERIRKIAGASGGSCASFQEQHHESVVPAILGAMRDSSPRVRAHACAALVSFMDEAKKPEVTPYFSGILGHLAQLVGDASRVLVQSSAITALAAVAQVVADDFKDYYDMFLPPLKTVLLQAHGDEFKKLRRRSMEAATIIMRAVAQSNCGMEARAAQDGVEVLGMLDEPSLAEAEACPYIFAAYARVYDLIDDPDGAVLGGLLQKVLPIAAAEPESRRVHPAEVDDVDPELWAVVPQDDAIYAFSVHGADAHDSALNMTAALLSAARCDITPFAQAVVQVVRGALHSAATDDSTMAAASVTIALLAGLADHLLPAYAKGVWTLEMPIIASRLGVEVGMEVVLNWCRALSRRKAPADSFMPDYLFKDVLEALNKLSQSYRSCVSKAQANDGWEDIDSDEEEDEEGEEGEEEEGEEGDDNGFGFDDEMGLDDLQDTSVTIVGILNAAWTLNPALMTPARIDSVMPFFTWCLEKERSIQDRQSGICALDDMLEFGNDAARERVLPWKQLLLDSCTDPSADVRQASVYAVRMMQRATHIFGQLAEQTLPMLAQLVEFPGALDKQNVFVTDNAIAAYVDIAARSGVPDAEYIKVVLGWPTMPCADILEAVFVFAHLGNLLEAGGPAMADLEVPKAIARMIAGMRTFFGEHERDGDTLELQLGITACLAIAKLGPEEEATLRASLGEADANRLNQHLLRGK